MNPLNTPKLFFKLFKWFCHPDFFEELQGDLEEAYAINIDKYGERKAKSIYRIEVLKMLRPSVMRSFIPNLEFNHLIMFKNYYKTSMRSLMKNPLTSFINLFGLSAALGISILVYAFIHWVYSVDEHHEYKDEVFMSTIFVNRDGQLQQNGLCPRPLGAMLKEDFAQVKKMCRIEDMRVVIKRDDNVFFENIRLADPDFLEMFTFPIKWGNYSSLRDVNSIVLSERMSKKYFGDENPVGKNMQLIYNGAESKTFKVSAVAAKFPANRDIHFNFLINLQNAKVIEPDYSFTDWGEFFKATFIQLDDPADIAVLEENMSSYKEYQNQAQPDWALSSFAFEPLATLNFKSADIEDDISWGNHDNHMSIKFLVALGSIMLILACLNYINISIVSAAKRLKEIGVRKAIGATRRVVIVQFLAENILVTLLAMIIGVGLGTFLFVPWFEQMNSFSLGLDFMQPELWIYLPAVLILTGIASGIYPAFYISKFQVTGIIKGSLKFGKKNPLTKAFLGIQLVLSCILIAVAVMFTQNNDYIAERGWGYDPSNTIYFKVHDQSAFEQMSNELQKDPNVLSISGSTDHVGHITSEEIIYLQDERQIEVQNLSADANYFKLLGLEVAEGRWFREDHESDFQSVVVNERFVEDLLIAGYEEQKIRIGDSRYRIIGVVKDFHNYSFYREIEPMILRLAREEEYKFLTMKVKDKSDIETYASTRLLWSELYPQIPFQAGHQEDVWGNYFKDLGNHGEFWRVIAFIAILMASLGLYGLVTLNVTGRVKEFSIKKVMGARMKNIANNILKQYVLLFTVALAIGAPLSYMTVDFIFEIAYTYHMPINMVGTILGVFILVFILVAVVAIQVRKITLANPVDGLRVE